MEKTSRRDFLKSLLGAGVAMALPGDLLAMAPDRVKYKQPRKFSYDAKGLPTVILGKTGVEIPRIVLGLGSRFCHMDSDQEAWEMLNYALDRGLYYWDTAHAYDNTIAAPPGKTRSPRLVVSEERMGPVVNKRRKEIFLSTKVTARDPDAAMREIELSLKRLQTDRLDMLKIHSVESMEDVEQMSRKGHLIDILHRLKEEGLTRFIGFSGHASDVALAAMADRGDFDSMLIAMNHWAAKQGFRRQELAVPAGKKQGMGVLLMKAVRPRETVPGLEATDLVRYALSLPGPDALVLGMDSLKVVDSNLEILRNFVPLGPEKMEQMAQQLAPFYRHENLPWMQPGYRDGHWG